MKFLTVRAYLTLILFDLYLQGRFSALHRKVMRCPTNPFQRSPDILQRVCAAVDMACIWYRKEVLCLQRAAATTCLLRKCGVHAEMIIGVQQMPFKSHAWVEVDGRVVNDKPYIGELYAVVDRL